MADELAGAPANPAAPESWIEAYNTFVDQADGPNPPHLIRLPAADLAPERAREILKLFDPEGDF